jgi:hypothetical protein
MTKKSPKKPSKPTFGRRLGGLLLWTLLFVLLLAAADQALLRLTPQSPLLVELQDCYRDLRSRLLAGPQQADSIEALLQEPEPPAQSYFYADSQGELHFVDSLQQVPPAYRNQAQPLAE